MYDEKQYPGAEIEALAAVLLKTQGEGSGVTAKRAASANHTQDTAVWWKHRRR